MQVVPLPHAINWFEATSRSLQCLFCHEAGDSERADYLTERLSSLLLQRLSPDVGEQLLALLPAIAGTHYWPMQAAARAQADTSIGFTDFIERTQTTLGVKGFCEETAEQLEERGEKSICRKIAEAYLWSVTHDLPPDLKARMSEELPPELRCRMNLQSSLTDESKVG